MYFSVNKPLRFGDKRYIPCVCYEITKENKSLVESLCEKGNAQKHSEYVFFVNGKILVKKTTEKTTKK